jgi:phosphoglycolate phosphatase-like HAD superfamily hydrolase
VYGNHAKRVDQSNCSGSGFGSFGEVSEGFDDPLPSWNNGPAKQAILTVSEKDWMEILAVTHSGMGTEDFPAFVKPWIASAKAPRFGRPYTDLVFQPMLEVMKHLREKGFKTYIVTGGGQEFVRTYSEQVITEH